MEERVLAGIEESSCITEDSKIGNVLKKQILNKVNGEYCTSMDTTSLKNEQDKDDIFLIVARRKIKRMKRKEKVERNKAQCLGLKTCSEKINNTSRMTPSLVNSIEESLDSNKLGKVTNKCKYLHNHGMKDWNCFICGKGNQPMIKDKCSICGRKRGYKGRVAKSSPNQISEVKLGLRDTFSIIDSSYNHAAKFNEKDIYLRQKKMYLHRKLDYEADSKITTTKDIKNLLISVRKML